MGWAGIALFVSGLLVAVASVVTRAVADRFTDDPIGELDIAQVYINKLLEVRDELTDVFLGALLWQGALIGVLGVVMMGLGVYGSFFRRRPALAVPMGPAAAGPLDAPEAPEGLAPSGEPATPKESEGTAR